MKEDQIDFFDEQFLRQSLVVKNAKKKNSAQQKAEYYDDSIIKQSMRKSYIVQMASKKKKIKIKQHINTEQQNAKKGENKGMLRSKIKSIENPLKALFQDFRQLQKTAFQISNIGIVKQQPLFQICKPKNIEQKCFLKFKSIRELEIKHSQQNKLLYSFNFDTIKVKVKNPEDSQYVQNGFILYINPQIKLHISCMMNKEYEIKAQKKIKKMISKSDGRADNLRQLLQKNPKFYLNRYRTAIQFAENCQTGDIILFQGSHFFANVQRFLTNSNFDHVGMIIRDPVYGILIFQSNSSTGVCLTPWQYLIKYGWWESIQKMVWRQLQGVERDSNFDLLIHEFVKANLGKNYFISLDKLVSNRSFIGKKEEEVGFFCSELVAKVYKDLGLLTRNPKSPKFKPSNNFYPYHFTQKFNLQLEKGYLSSEYQLYFNKDRLIDYYKA